MKNRAGMFVMFVNVFFKELHGRRKKPRLDAATEKLKRTSPSKISSLEKKKFEVG